jgi:hypothetical protein
MTAKPENRTALAATLCLATLMAAVATTTLGADSAPATKPSGPADAASSNAVISPQTQADALHFVIAADRELYFQMYLAHAVTTPSGQGKANWDYPADVLRRSAESIQRKGAEFSYALRSLDPINPRNGPQTELEKTGLAFVATHPTQTYYGREMLGGREYVTAVYPDLPAVAACISCHSQKSASASRYKVGESLGGLVVRIPLEL